MQHSDLAALADLEHLYYGQGMGGAGNFPAQQTTVISCPKKMVGRVIGKNGETIKALQQFTGAQIQIDQRCDPTRVSIAGSPKSLQVATSMVQDIVAGTFKGFAMLRSFATQAAKAPDALSFIAQPMPVYIEGYGFVPPSQFYDPGDAPAAPVYQQTLPALAADPVSVLRAISPGATSGSSGQAPSPQGMTGAQGGPNPLSQQLAMQAQLLGMRAASPLPDLGGYGHGHPGAYLRGLPPHFQQPQQHSIFTSDALAGTEALPHLPPAMTSVAASLPPLSSGASTTRSSQTAENVPLSVWSQLEALSPDGGPASGSPVLLSREHTPLRTPSRASTPPPPKEGAQAQTQEQAALLAQLQALSMLGSRALSPQPPQAQQQQQQPAQQQQQAQQQPAASAGLPLGWIQLRDPEQRCLWHNTLTGQSQYQPPASGAEAGGRGHFSGLGGELPQQLFY